MVRNIYLFSIFQITKKNYFFFALDSECYVFLNDKGEEAEKLTLSELDNKTEKIVAFLRSELNLKKGDRGKVLLNQ